MLIRKAIIPAAGLGTRFYPLTKVLPKEILPLVDLPFIDYVIREARDSDITQIIFVLQESRKAIADYFKKNQKLENILKKDNQLKESLKGYEEKEKEFEGLSFSSCFQQSPKGNAEAILKARNYIKKESFALLFPDDIFESKVPVLEQLKKIFQTSQKPVIGLKKVSLEKIASPSFREAKAKVEKRTESSLIYGIVKVEKIANKLYKIKEIQEKPKIEEAFSDLAIVGRYILTSDIFDYIKKTRVSEKGEIELTDTLNLMLKNGKVIYGYEISGEWLECGKKIDWLKSNLYLSLKHPKYGPILREYLKESGIRN